MTTAYLDERSAEFSDWIAQSSRGSVPNETQWYWRQAAVILDMWLEFPRGMDGFRIANTVATRLFELDTTNVDLEAVSAVHAVASALDRLDEVYKKIQNEAGSETIGSVTDASNPGMHAAASGVGNGVAAAYKYREQRRGLLLRAHEISDVARATLNSRHGTELPKLDPYRD